MAPQLAIPRYTAKVNASTVKNAELVEVIGLSGLSNDLFSQDCVPTAVDSLRFPLPLRLRI
jgi:hypothetical protein